MRWEKPCGVPARTAEIWGCLFPTLVLAERRKTKVTARAQKHELPPPECSLPQFPHPADLPGEELCFYSPSQSEIPGDRCDLSCHPSPGAPQRRCLNLLTRAQPRVLRLSAQTCCFGVLLLSCLHTDPLTSAFVHRSGRVSWLAACFCMFPPPAMTQASGI